MSAKWEQISDCTSRMESYTKLGKQEQNQTIDYYFLKPNWIRMKIVDGDNIGAEIVYNPIDKIIKAKAGGILGFITVKFSPDNPRVQSIRGHRIDHNNIGYIVNRWRKYLETYNVSISNDDSTITLNAVGIDTSKYYGAYSENITIDSKTYFPIHFEQFDISGQLIHRVIISNVQINVGLKRDFFDI
ncbi:DUF1571 domain-containing protein [bacterium]|nr:DUF1571 domain-containing protein [bacterium]